MRPKFGQLLAAVLVLTAWGCQDVTRQTAPTAEPNFLALASDLGFDTLGARVGPKYVVVEGDILLSKIFLRDQQGKTRNPVIPSDPRMRNQYAFQYGLTDKGGKTFTINFSDLPSDWATAARAAANIWAAQHSGFAFTEVTSGGDLQVTDDIGECNPNTVGCAVAPAASEEIGTEVRVYTGSSYANTYNKRLEVLLHEIGHTFGFRHDGSARLQQEGGSYTLIPGTNDTDGSSIMRWDICYYNNTCESFSSLSNGDVEGIRALFPAPDPTNFSISYPVSLSWTATRRTAYYEIRYLYSQWDYDSQTDTWSYNPYEDFVGTTSGTSYYDGRAYTGQYCSSKFNVRAVFDNGTKSLWGTDVDAGTC